MRNKFLLPAALGGAVPAGGCGKSENAPANAGSNVTLTAEQRRNIKLTTVTAGRFRKNVDTTGIVDFDNDQATAMLAPFSGTVSRLLVEPGQAVKKGEALADVVSPDYASAVSTYRKALVTAQNARKLADLDKDLLAHQGVSHQGSRTGRDRRRQRRSRPRCRPAGAAIPGRGSRSVIRDTKEGKDTAAVEGTIRSPIAGTVVEKLIQPGQLLQASTTPVFTVADLSKVWVMAHIFDTDLGAVHLGDTAQVTRRGQDTQRHGGQYRRRSGPQHPLHRGADRGRQSGRFPQAPDVCAGQDRRPPGRRRACSFPSRPSCMMTRIFLMSMSSRRTAALPAPM